MVVVAVGKSNMHQHNVERFLVLKLGNVQLGKWAIVILV